MQTLTTEKARGAYGLRLAAGSRNDRAQLVTLHTSDLFYSDPFLRSEVTGRNVFNCCLEQQPQISLGAGRAQYGSSARYLCQLRDRARWANCG